MEKLTPLQAYNARTMFLDSYYNHILSDDIGSLLDGMQFVGNMTADAAAWSDWIEAVDSGQKEITALQGFIAMQKYLHEYTEHISSNDVKAMLREMNVTSDGRTVNPTYWDNWIECWKIIAKNPHDSKSYLSLR